MVMKAKIGSPSLGLPIFLRFSPPGATQIGNQALFTKPGFSDFTMIGGSGLDTLPLVSFAD